MLRFSRKLIAVLFAFSSLAAAQQMRNDRPQIFPLEEVRAGMKGVGRTVFSGSEPAEFGVEILGVLPNYPGPRQSVIIARLFGPQVEKTGVFAGMSGSPVFIDGKLVGAIAYSFPFSKEPIAGITPIEQMISIFEQGQVSPPRRQAPRQVSFSELTGARWKPELPKAPLQATTFIAPVASGSPLASLLGQQLSPIATPVVFSGISSDALALYAPQLQAQGLLPVAGAGGGAAITPLAKPTEKTLAPGASVSVQLVRGDYSIAASGTVTMRDGEKVYAFGHPFLGLGTADMPMSESSVVSVIPSAYNSFKLTVPGQMVGRLAQDRATGILGQLGEAPKMIPVRIDLHTSRGRTEKYVYEVVSDQFLTPLLLNITVYNTIAANERSLGDSTVSVRGEIALRGQERVHLEQRFSSSDAPLLAANTVAAPVGTLLESGFEGVEIQGIDLDIDSVDVRLTGTLDRIALDRTEVARGETVEVQAFIRTESGQQIVQRIPVEIPADVPTGRLLLFVGNGGALEQSMATRSFVPKDLSQLVRAINRLKKNDRLYVKLFRLTPGAVIGTDELPNLPPSVLAMLSSQRTAGGYTPMPLSPIYERELPPAEFVIEGQQTLEIEVVR
jgi:hypothetical protein